MNTMKTLMCAVALSAVSFAITAQAQAGPREDIIASFGATGPANPAKGKAMYDATYGTGKVETPKCTTCHATSPKQAGLTRTGKVIDPLAVSRTPDRYTDARKVAKWFKRNCNGVIGRECTPQEKVDFIGYMLTQ